MPLPLYPRAAREKELSGEVVLDLEVDEVGVVKTSTIVSSTDPVFEKPARIATLLWRLKSRSAPFKTRVVVAFPPAPPTFKEVTQTSASE